MQVKKSQVIDITNGLTLEEKARLLNGFGSWFTYDCNGKLPSIMMTDGPHGLRKQQAEKVSDINDSEIATCYPTACASASSWDTQVLREIGEGIGSEAVKEKISIVLGPGTNIKRSPLCGRNFEYFSEDPFLAGQMASSWIDGVQSLGVGTSLKHFAVNSQETRRMSCDSRVDERALREIYLSAFESAIKSSQPMTVMAAYNKLNGTYCTQNNKLLNDILRGEWGFKGIVMSDWGAANDVVECIKNGMDLEMPDSGNRHTQQLIDAVKDGSLPIEQLDKVVQNMVELILTQFAKVKDGEVDYEQLHKLVVKLEGQCAVLLKNDNILPLSKTSKVVIVGEMAENMRFQGAGSSHINTTKRPNAIDALKAKGLDVTYCKGYNDYGDVVVDELEKQALQAAKNAEVVLFFGGLTDSFEGEGYDRNTLSMPTCQLQLIEKLYQVNKNIVFVAFGGSPFEMPFVDKVKGILNMYLGGQGVGEATADLLVGDVNPSGKLVETFPIKLSDTPCYNYFATKQRSVEMRESIFVGYRYYDTFNKPTLFDFGFGLSYTTFEYSDIALSSDKYEEGKLTVTFNVTNSGKVDGSEVAQLYVKNPVSKFIRANKELKGFAKVNLKAGQTKSVTIELDERSFSIYDVNSGKFVMPSGKYDICVGAAVRDIKLTASVEVKGVNINCDQTIALSEYFEQKGQTFTISDTQFVELSGLPIVQDTKVKRGEATLHHTLEDLMPISFIARMVFKIGGYMVTKGQPKDSPVVKMVVGGMTETPIDSFVTMSGGVFSKKFMDAILLDANGHFFKGIARLLKKD